MGGVGATKKLFLRPIITFSRAYFVAQSAHVCVFVCRRCGACIMKVPKKNSNIESHKNLISPHYCFSTWANGVVAFVRWIEICARSLTFCMKMGYFSICFSVVGCFSFNRFVRMENLAANSNSSPIPARIKCFAYKRVEILFDSLSVFLFRHFFSIFKSGKMK